MPTAIALSNMVSSVRRRANIENQTAFIPDVEIIEYINAGLASLYDLLVQAGGQPWYRQTKTFTTTSSASSYDLKAIGCADLYELASVDIQLGAGGNPTISAKPYMEFERNRYKYYPGWTFSTPVFYRLLGGSINFIPIPNGQFSITLNYYPVFVPLANGSDTFDGVNGWEEYAIWKAVADCRGKGDEDTSYALGKCAELERKITAMAEQRDTGSAERMTETFAEVPWDFGAR